MSDWTLTSRHPMQLDSVTTGVHTRTGLGPHTPLSPCPWSPLRATSNLQAWGARSKGSESFSTLSTVAQNDVQVVHTTVSSKVALFVAHCSCECVRLRSVPLGILAGPIGELKPATATGGFFLSTYLEPLPTTAICAVGPQAGLLSMVKIKNLTCGCSSRSSAWPADR